MGQTRNGTSVKQSNLVYEKIMETLVHEEIHRQMKAMPSKLLRYIDASEVATFALNRLPPLYASSEQGKEKQAQKGESKLKQEVATAVRQALAAVQRDPLRSSTPLPPPDKDPRYGEAKDSLKSLEDLLRKSHLLDASIGELTWDNLNLAIARAMKKTASKGMISRHLEALIGDADYGKYTSSVHDWTDHQYH